MLGIQDFDFGSRFQTCVLWSKVSANILLSGWSIIGCAEAGGLCVEAAAWLSVGRGALGRAAQPASERDHHRMAPGSKSGSRPGVILRTDFDDIVALDTRNNVKTSQRVYGP